MKKIALLSLFLTLGLMARAQAQTYLVDLFENQAGAYTGNADTDFGIAGSVVDVGGSIVLPIFGATSGDPVIYSLGSVGSLSLTPPYGAYDVNGGSSSTDPLRLTGGFIYSHGTTAATGDTLTLTVASGSSVDISGIGSIQNFEGTVDVSDGVSTQGALVGYASDTAGLPPESTGMGTFTPIAAFSDDVATTYTISFFDSTGDGEADLSGLLITINPPSTSSVPEPASWALIGAGLIGLAGWQMLRRRATRA